MPLTVLRILLGLLACAAGAGCVAVLMSASTGVGRVAGGILFLATCVLLVGITIVEAVLSTGRKAKSPAPSKSE